MNLKKKYSVRIYDNDYDNDCDRYCDYDNKCEDICDHDYDRGNDDYDNDIVLSKALIVNSTTRVENEKS